MRRNAHPQFSTRQDGPGGRAMDEESRRERILPGPSRPYRKGRRDPRAAEKPRLKPARSNEEPAPWSPKESPPRRAQAFAQNRGWAWGECGQ